MGQKSGSIEGLQERSGVDEQSSERQRGKDRAKREQINRFIEILECLRRDLLAMEEGFRDRDGDAWREDLALRILDAYEIPERRDDESIGKYRRRLEEHLIDEMLNPDGSIKRQYQQDPSLSDYAQWAQKKFHYNRARGLVRELQDGNKPPERREEIIEALEQSNIEVLTFADRETSHNSAWHQVKQIADDLEDTATATELDQNTSANFLKP